MSSGSLRPASVRSAASALWALGLLRLAAGQAVCTSLDGPRCEAVNGLGRRAAAAGAGARPRAAAAAGWRERLVETVSDLLSASASSATRPPLAGAFKVRGDLADANGRFLLEAGDWVLQPEGWITVGLRGAFGDNVTLVGEIVDGDGYPLESCSRFALQRRPPANDAAARDQADEPPARHALAPAVWEGVYICAGTPTRLLLTLEPDARPFASAVHGVFEFSVLRDLSASEATEVARLVSESLFDGLDGLDADDDDLVVRVVVDAKAVDLLALAGMDDDDDDDDYEPAP
ncbi:hypothetical protein M885DRAFT_541838 [Pelagophyceae sp. CCMP2097]|nr:hypothetical protein M885DRAFT_541838 [Pelagophyceae sp. CCMP2097]